MITMDLWPGETRAPHRGDRLGTTKTLYYVLHARKVNRRDPATCPRFALKVARADDLTDGTRNALLRSACRRNGSYLYEFKWYPRKKKAISFENYMKAKV